MALHVGWQRRRWRGLLVAGLCFILPAVCLSALCAWAYVRCGALPQAQWLLYGLKPVVLAVVAQAIVGLFPTAARTGLLRAVGAIAALANALGGAAGALLCVLGVARPG
jgi:chromate transporter